MSVNKIKVLMIDSWVGDGNEYALHICNALKEAGIEESVANEFIAARADLKPDQIVEEVELKASATAAENKTLFGYIGAWDQYRISHNKITGFMRSNSTPDFSYWHLARNFASRPTLNSDFVTMDGEYATNPDMKRIFAVQDEQSFIVEIGNILKCARPMPFLARPGGLG